MTWEVKFPSQFFLEEIMSSIKGSEVKKICLACEAGAGSSLMVKNGLIKILAHMERQKLPIIKFTSW